MTVATRVWAHRGASAYAPENTLPAFALALNQGADGVEFDVQLTRDGVPVVIHDETVDRTTNGTGGVVDHTLEQLRALDASNNRPGYSEIPIPTMEEVLGLLAPSGVWINIELKNSEEPYPGLEEKVVEAVRRYELGERVVLSSFSNASIRRLHDLAPELELGTLYSRPQVRPWRSALRLGAKAVHPPARLTPSRAWVRRAQTLGLAIRPWIVNNPEVMARLFRWGVDAIITDTPDVARERRWRA